MLKRASLVPGFAIGDLEVGEDELHRLVGVGVGEGGGGRGHPGFQGVAHDVHARVRGHARWHLGGQRRVEDGDVRHHVGRDDGVLDVLDRVGDDGEGRDLGGRSARGGDGREAGLVPQRGHGAGGNDVLELELRVLVEAPHDLGRVDGRAAADGDDPVGLKVEHGLGPSLHGLDGGIGLDAVDDDTLHPGLGEELDRLVEEAEFLHRAAAGDDRGLLALEGGELLNRLFAIDDVAGNGETENCHINLHVTGSSALLPSLPYRYIIFIYLLIECQYTPAPAEKIRLFHNKGMLLDLEALSLKLLSGFPIFERNAVSPLSPSGSWLAFEHGSLVRKGRNGRSAWQDRRIAPARKPRSGL